MCEWAGQIRGRQGWSHNSQEYLSDTRLPIKRPPHFGVQNHRQEYKNIIIFFTKISV